MNDFLPKTYSVPQQSNYTKFPEGETVLRILERPILGYELWIGGKPKRYEMNESIPMSDLEKADINKISGEPGQARHFWAMTVWNYETNQIQIWQVTQKKIMNKIRALAQSKAWGSPLGYDISVTRTGTGMDSDYEVLPGAKGEVSKEIQDKYQAAHVNLDALYLGADPFAGVVNNPAEDVAQDAFNALA